MRQFNKFSGIIIALIIILLWSVSLLLFLRCDLSRFNLLQIFIGIWWQTFLYTGLFINSHEAIHGLVYPSNLKLNNFIGSLSVSLYACFAYDQLWKKHWLHHHYPASELDPDFHDGKNSQFWAWYWHFFKGYWSWWRIGLLISVFGLISYLVKIALIQLVLFILLPSLLSSLQLFYFGTFLPHRHHQVTSIYLPMFWSLITCYHFGYHQEHHDNPEIPWWKLPDLI